MGAQSGFAIAFQEFIFYAGPVIQLLYWVVLAVAAVYAVLLFKRLVDHKTGAAEDTAQRSVSGRPGDAVNVDEFVE